MILLKNAFVSPQTLAQPYSGGHVRLDKDARNVQIGCALLKTHTENETNKPNTDLVLSRTLKSHWIQPNANALRLYGPSSFYGQT